MRAIDYREVVSSVKELCVASCYELPGDVLEAIKAAKDKETNASAVDILAKLIENAKIAPTTR